MYYLNFQNLTPKRIKRDKNVKRYFLIIFFNLVFMLGNTNNEIYNTEICL